MHPLVSCVILNYNGEKFLKKCLESVRALDYENKEVIFLDNASKDSSVDFVRQNFSSSGEPRPTRTKNMRPDIRIVVTEKNTGYAGGANRAVKEAKGEFVLILNPDIIFEPGYISTLIRHMDADPKIAAITGKLLHYDFEHDKKTNTIDSTGLRMYHSRRCVDRGQGEIDSGQYDEAEEVFGVTGACPLYRKSALLDCAIGGEIFDESFFMYKEDVDIAWRMRLFGWKAFYEPKAVAYHGRGTGAIPRETALEVVKNRSSLSKFQKQYSYRNERLMRIKNELWLGVSRDFFSILFKEIVMAGWMTVREPFLWKSLGTFLWKIPEALKKRQAVMKKRRVSWKEIKKWFV